MGSTAGLNARATRAVSETARRFDCEAWIQTAAGKSASARDLLGLLMLGVGPGEHVTVTCQGPDAREALAALVSVLQGSGATG